MQYCIDLVNWLTDCLLEPLAHYSPHKRQWLWCVCLWTMEFLLSYLIIQTWPKSPILFCWSINSIQLANRAALLWNYLDSVNRLADCPTEALAGLPLSPMHEMAESSPLPLFIWLTLHRVDLKGERNWLTYSIQLSLQVSTGHITDMVHIVLNFVLVVWNHDNEPKIGLNI